MKKSLFFCGIVCYFFVSLFCFTTTCIGAHRLSEVDQDSIRWAHRTEYAISCVDALKSKNYTIASRRFDSEMRQEITDKDLENFWIQFLEKCGGELYHILDIKREESNTFFWIYPSYKAKTDNWQFRIGFNDEDSITAFHIDRYIPPPQENKWQLPQYVSTDSTTIREFTINKGKDYELTAYLTIPTWNYHTPCVIFVHDAGPWDKDAARYSNKPFADLAWGLATRGISSVRIDKRTYVHYKQITKKNIPITPTFDTEEDIFEIIRHLSKKHIIDTNNLFLLGQGLGANILPRIATKSGQIKGMILLAPYGRPLEDCLLEEVSYILNLDTLNNYESKKKTIAKLQRQTKNVKSPSLNLSTPPTDLPFDTPASYWIDIKNYNPFKMLKNTNLPALILRGERDFRTSATDFNIWKSELHDKNADTGKYLFISYPNLNNIMMSGEGKSTPWEYHEPNNVSKQVIDDISSWLWKYIKSTK